MGVTYKKLEIDMDLVGGVMALTISGKLEREDYDILNREIDALLTAHERLRLLVELRDFHGWTAGAAWEDAKLGMRHFNDIERLAIIGENRWQQGMAMFVKPFTRADVRYFDVAEADAAHAWITAGD